MIEDFQLIEPITRGLTGQNLKNLNNLRLKIQFFPFLAATPRGESFVAGMMEKQERTWISNGALGNLYKTF